MCPPQNPRITAVSHVRPCRATSCFEMAKRPAMSSRQLPGSKPAVDTVGRPVRRPLAGWAAEIAVLSAAEKGLPVGLRENQGRTVRVPGVAHGDRTVGRHRDLNAVAAGVAPPNL